MSANKLASEYLQISIYTDACVRTPVPPAWPHTTRSSFSYLPAWPHSTHVPIASIPRSCLAVLMFPFFCNPPVHQPTYNSMEATKVIEQESTITVLTLRPNLEGLSLDNDEAMLAGEDLFSSATDGAVSLEDLDDTDVQVSPLPTLPLALLVTNPLANSGAVPPSQQSSSSVPAADPRRLNGKAPRHLVQHHGQPQPAAVIHPYRRPAAKAPAVQSGESGAADVQLPAVNAITPLRLSAWAGKMLGSDQTNMARSLAWGIHAAKLALQQKTTEEPEAYRRRLQAVHDNLVSLLFTEVDGKPVMGPLAPSGPAYLNHDGQSLHRTVDVNRDDIVVSEERISPVDTDRVRFTRN